jgi:NAD(P) transhydrogenase subunit alpha
VIEAGAGVHSQATDDLFTAAGATVKSGDVISGADVVLSVTSLTPAQIGTLKKGAVTISFLSPVTALATVTSFALYNKIHSNNKIYYTFKIKTIISIIYR